jgi:uncharacterized protein (DUF433 family)
MNYSDRIIADYRVMLGKPVIKGTRITVELILRKLAEGATPADLLSMYPHLTDDDVRAALQYAAGILANEEIIEPIG